MKPVTPQTYKRTPMNMLEMEKLIDELRNMNGILSKDLEFYKQVVDDQRKDHIIYKDYIKTLTGVIDILGEVLKNGK